MHKRKYGTGSEAAWYSIAKQCKGDIASLTSTTAVFRNESGARSTGLKVVDNCTGVPKKGVQEKKRKPRRLCQFYHKQVTLLSRQKNVHRHHIL